MRVFDGSIKVGDKIRMMGTGRTFTVTELGRYTPFPQKLKSIEQGEVGYVVAAIKSLGDVRVGDTVTLEHDPAPEALPGYEEPKQMVFCDFYPASGAGDGGKRSDFESLREAVERLHINDASFTLSLIHI